MRITPGWKAVFKTNSPLLLRPAAQHRSISLNSGIQQGILAENSRRLPKGRPKSDRDGLDSLLHSVPGRAARNTSARRDFKSTPDRFSRGGDRSSQRKVTRQYGDTEQWKPRGPARGGRAASSGGQRRRIIPELDDMDGPDELEGRPRGSGWSKTPSRGRDRSAPSRRRPSQYQFDDDPARSSFRRQGSSAAEQPYPPRERRQPAARKFDGGRFDGERKFNSDRSFDSGGRPSRFDRDDSDAGRSAPSFRQRSTSSPAAGRSFEPRERRRSAPYAPDDDSAPPFRGRSSSAPPPADRQPPLRERRKAAIGRKFEAETQRKDAEEARVRGPFGTVPDDMDDMPPKRFPLASAASEMVYGRNAIAAALRGGRRKVHKLWVCQRAFVDKERDWHDSRKEAAEIEKLVTDAGAEVAFVSRHWLPLMDAVAGYRQHNGLILDASPIPVPQITNLLPWSSDSNGPYYEVARANASEDASRQARVRYGAKDGSQAPRRPIVVLLCNVTDTGNLGAICRSAYWYDIDGVVIPKRASAGPSAPAAKASSGGIEGVNILCVDDVKGFIKQSQRAGWHVMAAMPPPAEEKPASTPALEFDVSKPDSGIAKLDEEKGVLLVLGGEDAGVPERFAEMANSYITMSRSKPDALGVDSLNVSVAAALIFSEFARTRPAGVSNVENLLF